MSLIFKNIKRNMRRSVLTGLSIAISIFIFCLLLSITGAIHYTLDEAGKTLTLLVQEGSSGSFFFGLPVSYVPKIREIPGVAGATPFKFYLGLAGKDIWRNQVFAMGVDIATIRQARPEVQAVSDEEFNLFTSKREGALVGASLIKQYNWKVGDRFILKGLVPPIDLEIEIKGIIPFGTFREIVLVRLDYLEEVLRDKEWINLIGLKVDRPELLPVVAKTIDETFKNYPTRTRTWTEKSFMANMVKIMGNITLAITAISTVLFIATLTVSFNSISMSIMERMTELGVLKVIGFRSFHLFGFVVGESSLICFLGGLAGSISSFIIFYYFPIFFPVGTFAYLSVSQEAVIMGIGISLIIGILSGFIPAVKAWRLKPVEVLRRVE
jgi:putative ABC transport system permease protein